MSEYNVASITHHWQLQYAYCTCMHLHNYNTIASVPVCVKSIAKAAAASVRPNGVRTLLTTAISIFTAFINV